MMSRAFPVLSVGVVCLSCFSSAAYSSPLRTARLLSTTESIDAYVQEQLESQHIVGLGLGVVVDGTVFYSQGYGFEDRARAIPASASTTLFRWASVSKTITAVTAMTLVDEGILELDRDISSYYSGYEMPTSYLVDGSSDNWPTDVAVEAVPSGSVITLRMLLGHLAGIQHYDNGVAVVTPPLLLRNNPNTNTGFEWALNLWIDAPLVDIPGNAYHYSTPAFNLAGTVIGAAFNAAYGLDEAPDGSFTHLVDDRISAVAGARSLQPDYQWEALDHRAVGYLLLEDGSIKRDTNSDVSWKLPGGGFVSTAEDAAAYCSALMDKDILSGDARNEMWSTQYEADGTTTGYGLGFGIGSRNGNFRVSHNGEQEKALSRLVLYPDDGLGIVILTNTHAAEGAENPNLSQIVNGVEDIIRNDFGY